MVQSSYFVRLAIAITAIFGGCCVNNIALELVVKADKGCGVLLTFLQFAVVSLEALPSQLQRSKTFPYIKLTPRIVPVSVYLGMVLLFWSSSTLNNLAFYFNISLPLNTIFRSSTMVCNVLLGVLFLNKRFSSGQVLSVFTVTVGVVMVTLVSLDSSSGDQEISSLTTQVLGVVVLVSALLLTTSLGIMQDWTKAKFGKAPDEMRFYSHALALPIFLLSYSNMWDTFVRWQTLQSSGDYTYELDLAGYALDLPILYLSVAAYCITQIACIGGVFMLLNLTSSLSVQVVIALRKFLTLLLSIMYFHHPFTYVHWIGSIFAFGGSFLYAYTSMPPPTPAPPKKKQN